MATNIDRKCEWFSKRLATCEDINLKNKNPKHSIACDIPRYSFTKRPQHRIFQFRPLIELRARGSRLFWYLFVNICGSRCPAYCTPEIKIAMYYPPPGRSKAGLAFETYNHANAFRVSLSNASPSAARSFVIYGPCNANRKFILETVQPAAIGLSFTDKYISPIFYSESYLATFSPQRRETRHVSFYILLHSCDFFSNEKCGKCFRSIHFSSRLNFRPSQLIR